MEREGSRRVLGQRTGKGGRPRVTGMTGLDGRNPQVETSVGWVQGIRDAGPAASRLCWVLQSFAWSWCYGAIITVDTQSRFQMWQLSSGP